MIQTPLVKRLLRALVGVAVATAAAASTHAADDWLNLATVSMTNATTPKLTNRYVCYTDGTDISCNSPSLYVTTGGLVGIGTAVPGYKLVVAGAQNANDLVILNTTTGGSLRLGLNDTYASVFTQSNHPLYFGTNGVVPQLMIATSGNVGISTTSPNAKLDVYGTISATNFVGSGAGLTGITAASADRIVSGTTSMLAVSDTGYISLTQSGVNTGWFNPSTGFVTIGVSSTGGLSGTTGYFSGNVGIGTTNAQAPLHVNGGIRLGNSMRMNGDGADRLAFYAGGSNLLEIGDDFATMNLNSTRIGVKTGTPTADFQVSGSMIVSKTGQAANEPSLMVSATNGAVGIGMIPVYGAQLEIRGSTYIVGDPTFGINQLGGTYGALAWRGQIQSMGNDTGRSTFSLRREGGATATDLIESFTDNGTTPALFVKGDGKVGIGTADPSATLHISSSVASAVPALKSVLRGNASWAPAFALGWAKADGTSEYGLEYVGFNDGANKIVSLRPYGNPTGVQIEFNDDQLAFTGRTGFTKGISGPYHDDLVLTQGYNSSGTPKGVRIFSLQSNANLAYFREDGNVGIGTTNPNATLDVYGTISATNFIGNGSGLTGVVASSGDRIVSGSTSMIAVSNTGFISLTQSGVNTGWFNPSTGFVTIGVSSTGGISGTTGYFSGRVGIGVAAPAAALDVLESAIVRGFGLNVYGGNILTSSNANMKLYAHNGGSPVIDLVGGNRSSTALTIDESNRVGIGTAYPSTTLHVNSADGLRISAPLGPGGYFTDLVPQYNGDYPFYLKVNNFGHILGVKLFAGTSLSQATFLNGYYGLGFATGDDPATADLRMVILQDGKVGIATATPTVALEVSGTISATNFVGNGSGLTGVTAAAAGVSGSIQFSSGGVLAGRSDIIISDSGNVGIGTANPTTLLDIAGGNGNQLQLTSGNPDWATAVHLVTGDANGHWVLQAMGSGALVPNQFSIQNSNQGGTPPLNITYDKKVGLGTLYPSSTLHLYGTAANGAGLTLANTENSSPWQIQPGWSGWYGNSLLIGDSAATHMRLVDNGTVYLGGDALVTPTMTLLGGNVGIGTTAPSDTLHVTERSNPAFPHSIRLNGRFAGHYLDGDTYARSAIGQNAPGADGVSTDGVFLNVNGSTTFDANGSGMAIPAARTLVFYTSNGSTLAERVRINNIGNVGISNTTPLAKLDVVGTISASDAIQVGTSSLACGAGIPGALRYNSGALEVCNGSSWSALLATGSGGYADRIVSGTTSMVAVSNTGFISLTQSGVNTGWFNPSTGFVTIGVSSTGTVSATTAYIASSTLINSTTLLSNAVFQATSPLYGKAWSLVYAPDTAPASNRLSWYNGITENFYVVGNDNIGRSTIGFANNGLSIGAGGNPGIGIDSSNQVGIGTQYPSNTLHVAGTLGLQPKLGGFTVTPAHSYDSGGNQLFDSNLMADNNDGGGANGAAMQFGGSGIYLRTREAGSGYGTSSSAVVVKPNGNVGIGTDTPSSKLHLYGAGDVTERIESSDASSNASTYYVNGSMNYSMGLFDTSFGINYGPTRGLTMDTSGKVGIGWVTPTVALEVSGTISATNFVGNGSGLTGVVASSGDRIVSGTTSMIAVSTTGYISLTQSGVNTGWFNPSTGFVTIGVSSTGTISSSDAYFGTWARFGPDGAYIQGASGDLALTGGSGVVRTGWGQTFRVLDGSGNTNVQLGGSGNSYLNVISGNVGVNTTAPTAVLQVSGTFTVSNSQQGATSPSLYIGGNGNIGIGTSAASNFRFMLNETDNQGLLGIYRTGSFSGTDNIGQVSFGYAGDSLASMVAVREGANDAGALFFGTQATGQGALERMRITSAGNVGIGTSTPQATLQVSGTFTVSTSTQTTTPSLYVNSSGNVGFGTTNPNEKLKIVSGSVISVRVDALENNIRFQHSSADSPTAAIGYSRGGTVGLYNGLVFSVYDGSSWKNNMYVGNNGNVGIGTTNPQSALDVSGTIRHSGIVIDLSDRRLKSNIRQLPTSLEAMVRLNPVSFTMNDNPSQTELGFIAQDVQPLFPNLVVTGTDPSKTLSLNYIGFIAPIVKAMQELKADNDNLREELKAANDNHRALMHEVEGLKRAIGQ